MLVQHQVLPDGSMEPELTPCGQAQGEKKEQLRRLMGKAKEDWKAADHPNWSIRDMDSAHFLDSNLQPGLQVGLPVPLCLTLRAVIVIDVLVFQLVWR